MTSGTEIILGKLGAIQARHEHSISVPDSTSLNHCLQTSHIETTLQPLGYGPPKIQASPSTGQPSKDVLLIKCLELGVVIGVAMACCSVTNIGMLLCYEHFPLTAPSGPKV